MKEMTLDEIKKIQLDILVYIDKVCKENNIKYSLGYGTLLGAVRHKGFIPWDDDIDIFLVRQEYNRLLDILYGSNNDSYKIFSMKDEGYFYAYAKVSDNSTLIREKNWPDYKDLGVNIDIFPIDYIPEGKEDEFYQEARHYQRCLHNCLTDIAYVHDKKYMRLMKKMLRHKKVKKCRKKSEWYWKNNISEMTQIKDSNKMACIVDEPYCVWGKEMFESFTEIEFENGKYCAVNNYDQMLKSLYGDYMKLPPENERESYHDFTAFWKQK